MEQFVTAMYRLHGLHLYAQVTFICNYFVSLIYNRWKMVRYMFINIIIGLLVS